MGAAPRRDLHRVPTENSKLLYALHLIISPPCTVDWYGRTTAGHVLGGIYKDFQYLYEWHSSVTALVQPNIWLYQGALRVHFG